jgi:8-oxo-dGTP pyrophosphatase MutT (NUDIX family)
VDTGEAYLDAAIREFQEELGAQVNLSDLVEVLRLSPCVETGNEFVRVYLCKNYVRPLPDPHEILELGEFTVSEITRLVEADEGCFCKSFVHLFSLVSSTIEKF